MLTLGSVSREFLSAAIQYIHMLFPALDALTREQRRRLEAKFMRTSEKREAEIFGTRAGLSPKRHSKDAQ